MDLEYESFYHVDLSMQINNKWKEDTVLGIVKDSRKFSIKIKGRDKEIIKKKYIFDNKSDSNKRHNRKIIALTYSYLLYKSLCAFSEANPLLLCRDVRPEKLIIHYLQKICNFFNNKKIFNRIIKFRKKVEFKTTEKLPESLAGKYARKVYQNKLPASKIINKEELEELINVIGKIL